MPVTGIVALYVLIIVSITSVINITKVSLRSRDAVTELWLCFTRFRSVNLILGFKALKNLRKALSITSLISLKVETMKKLLPLAMLLIICVMLVSFQDK